MSIQRSYQATFQIVNLSLGAGGSGVAIWRDNSNKYLYVATAYHVIEGMIEGIFIDYLGKKYNNFMIVIADKTYDFALVELRNVPTLIPTVTIAPRNSINTLHGDDIYVIGWPLLMDSNSVSNGSIRSPRWNANGIMNQLLISAPIFGGNSGGGVFLKRNNQLIGIVSWGIVNNETMNGVVSHSIILEALFYFMYRPTLVTPAKISGESYLFGVNGMLIDPFTMQYWLNPTNSIVSIFGNTGMIVLSVLPNSPAFFSGFSSIIYANQKFTFDILWGLKKPGSNTWTLINEENSLDTILYSFYATSNHSRRTILSQRSSGGSSYDIILPENLIVECLISRVINNVPNNVFVTRTVTLVKRDAYYDNYGVDPSTFSNEFLFGKRCDMRNNLQKNTIVPESYGRQFLSSIL
jgi:S1-C subfamily serine protease